MYIEKELDNAYYLVDENNNNIVNLSYCTKEEAIEMLDSLINCKDCEDCKNSSNLINCLNCTNCTNCTTCTDCTDCENCRVCYKCELCKDCINCDHCEDSKYLKNCGACIICEYCENCHICRNCKNLRLRNSIDELYNFDLLNVEDRENLKKEIKSIYNDEYNDRYVVIGESKKTKRKRNLRRMNELIEMLRDSEHLLLSENYCDEYLEKY